MPTYITNMTRTLSPWGDYLMTSWKNNNLLRPIREKETEQTVKWIDLNESEPDEEGIYFITRGPRPFFVEEAAYDPEANEFIGYNDEEDWIVAWSSDPIEPYKGDGSKSDERWNIYPDDPPEENTTFLVTCEGAAGNRFIQHAIIMRGELLPMLSYMWPRKPFLRALAWMYFPAPYEGRM